MLFLALYAGCDTVAPLPAVPDACDEILTAEDVELLIQRAVAAAEGNGEIAIAVTDREANLLGLYVTSDTISNTVILDAAAKARTAAYLSSNQHGFTTLTASFITRPHFPPGIANTPAGPLYGVGFSSLPGGDIQPNGGALNDKPGGVPLFKGECLVGGIGIAGLDAGFNEETCDGVTLNEVIAHTAAQPFGVSPEKRADNILAGGIRIRFSNVDPEPKNFPVLPTLDNAKIRSALRSTPARRFPPEGPVMLGSGFDFPITDGTVLTSLEVNQIIQQAVDQANRTRAAIRRPIGSPARVFVSVVDLNGKILGIWRTPDATLFSFDVAAQKARTALAFSDPDNIEFGRRIRDILGLSSTQPSSITTRAVGSLSQEFYPPGIDRDSLGRMVRPGPLYEGRDFQYQRRLLAMPGLPAYGNGITIFPGGIPLYKDGRLAGAIGVSGDGVDQDDVIAAAGTRGFEAPAEIRCDQLFYDGVRLPYVKFPRRAEL
ncbi:MAG: heme-binding protein [Bacteroidota bacterium]|jgi:uncharacterized protein GlcG (DUF336 family)